MHLPPFKHLCSHIPVDNKHILLICMFCICRDYRTMNRIGCRLITPSTVTRCYSANPSTTNSRRPSKLIDEIIRVDHAGELGADRIYAGQVAVLGDSKIGPTLKHMWEQERKHRQEFERLIGEYRVRPTAMTPIWNIAGFALGAGTALMGEKAAMACTVAVETVIVEHYNDQLRQIMESPSVDKVIEISVVCCVNIEINIKYTDNISCSCFYRNS